MVWHDKRKMVANAVNAVILGVKKKHFSNLSDFKHQQFGSHFEAVLLYIYVDEPEPRANEHGGKYGRGVVVKKYNPGQDITVRIQLTASHMG